MQFRIFFLVGLFGALLAMMTSGMARACPFCSAVSQTFSEEMASMDVVAIAELIDAPPVPESAGNDPNSPLPKATFRVDQVLKGQQWVNVDQKVQVLYFGDTDKSRPYLMMATDPPSLMWSTPLGLSDRALKYVMSLRDLPKDSSRLKFFQEYLEDPDEMLARDAYDEFAKVPYEGVKALKDAMHHDRLIQWIQQEDVPASRRRLYFTLLGVCGTEQDTPLLESMMKSDDRKQKAGLDALIACYLMLEGKEGLPLVEELFLKDADAEYADTYAAIMAIRFHGTQAEKIDRDRLLESLRYMLDRPELADLVIQDLARWEDWKVMDRLVKLFKQADEKSSWVRVPVINYLRACPLPQAEAYIEELEQIDPDAVKRARTFFPFDPEGEKTPPDKQAAESAESDNDSKEVGGLPLPPANSSSQHGDKRPTDAIADSNSLDDTRPKWMAGVGVALHPVATVSPVSATAADDSASATDDIIVTAQSTQSPADPVANPDAGTDTPEIAAARFDRPHVSESWANQYALAGVALVSGLVIWQMMRLSLGLPWFRWYASF